jgi:hypothetical protein
MFVRLFNNEEEDDEKNGKMPDEEKMEMMARMMNKSDSNSCNEMMEKMSGMIINDSLSIEEMASEMMPVCVESILLTLDKDLQVQFLVDLTKAIIVNGYDTLPAKDKPYLKIEIFKVIEGLK